jgi:hypothetical protein
VNDTWIGFLPVRLYQLGCSSSGSNSGSSGSSGRDDIHGPNVILFAPHEQSFSYRPENGINVLACLAV